MIALLILLQITIGSKNFEENRLLAEMFARVIETQTDLVVERRFNLAGTQVCFEALRSGDIDIYPEYTGTGLLSILHAQDAGTDPFEVLAQVRREFRHRWDLEWLAPLGFENSYEIAVRRDLAQRLGLRTISDLVPHAGELRAAFGYEFVERPDGLPGLRDRYGLQLGQVLGMQQNLKIQSAMSGEVDVLDVYTTDGIIDRANLVVLDDDRGFFPPYAAAPLVRGETLRRHPELAWALASLSGTLDETRMRALNRRLQEDGESADRVAHDALEALGLAGGVVDTSMDEASPGLVATFRQRRRELMSQTLRHLMLVGVSLLLAAVVAIPLGVMLERQRRAAEPVIRAVGLLQTIPSLALLAFMIPLLGVGAVPAIFALFLYSLFPMLRNTFSGVRDADPAAVEAAEALGMTHRQVLMMVRLPLAAPIIMAGVRTAAVISVGTATLAALIGAGGLGEPIVAGLQRLDSNLILAGALPAAALAVAVDVLLAGTEALVRPRGLAQATTA